MFLESNVKERLFCECKDCIFFYINNSLIVIFLSEVSLSTYLSSNDGAFINNVLFTHIFSLLCCARRFTCSSILTLFKSYRSSFLTVPLGQLRRQALRGYRRMYTTECIPDALRLSACFLPDFGNTEIGQKKSP